MNEASCTTRAKVITIKYENMIHKLVPLFEKEVKIPVPFPTLEQYDLVDLLFYFSLLFTNATDEYKENLQSLLSTQAIEVSPELFREIHLIVFPFIKWLKEYT